MAEHFLLCDHYEARERSVIDQERLATNTSTHRRVQIRGACRLPQWLADWVMEEGDEGRKVEKTLIEYFRLKPPPKTVIISSRA